MRGSCAWSDVISRGSCPLIASQIPLLHARGRTHTPASSFPLRRAFSDGTAKPDPLQSAPGQFNENTFRSLDRVVAEAGKRGIRTLLCLTNYWDDFGGISVYLKWARDAGENVSLTNKDDFFRNPRCKQMFKDNARAILTRKNTVNGIEYRNDPGIIGAMDALAPPLVSRCAHSQDFNETAWEGIASGDIPTLVLLGCPLLNVGCLSALLQRSTS